MCSSVRALVHPSRLVVHTPKYFNGHLSISAEFVHSFSGRGAWCVTLIPLAVSISSVMNGFVRAVLHACSRCVLCSAQEACRQLFTRLAACGYMNVLEITTAMVHRTVTSVYRGYETKRHQQPGTACHFTGLNFSGAAVVYIFR